MRRKLAEATQKLLSCCAKIVGLYSFGTTIKVLKNSTHIKQKK